MLTIIRYMQAFKCNVTGASPSARPLAKAEVPTYCEGEPEKCVKSAKQMFAWHQATGNNTETKSGITPNYNQKCGWVKGAQTDIFHRTKVDNDGPALSTSSSGLLIATQASKPSSTIAVLPSISASSSVVATPRPPRTCSARKARHARQST
jgi:hypothetical protein